MSLSRSGKEVTYETLRPRTVGHLRRLHAGGIELDIDGVQLYVNGHAVHLALKEFALLHQLMEHAGKVRTRRELLDAVWGEDQEDGNKTLEQHVRRLRLRLDHNGASRDCIRTVRGLGYVFDLELPESAETRKY